MQALLGFFQWVAEFFSVGIYELLTAAFASFIEWLTILKFQTMLWTLSLAWDVAQVLISNLGISSALSAAWGSFDSVTLSNLMFFRVPDAVNMILSALGTRFVLRFLPSGW